MFAEFWRDAFRENKSLIHVDLSHNNIPKLDVEIIADGLKDNHSIYGLHMSGNQGYVDNQGFVIPAEDETKADNMIVRKIGADLKSACIKAP
jgi:hypothetical protein